MASKISRKQIPLTSLVSSDAINARLADNYDLESLRAQVLAKGRIITALIVEPMAGEEGKYLVLAGNRRKRVADLIVADPAAPADVKAAVSKLDCSVHEGLSDDERDSLIFDHGETRPLNREETVLAVWRLFKQFKNEREIGSRLYYLLARYTGNETKLNSLPVDPAGRAKYLSDWFRGTLGQYILSAATMTDEVREQFLLTARKEDGRLKEGESVAFICTRPRVVELSKARTADQKAAGWSPLTGGETFNALIQQFKQEDAGHAITQKPKRPSIKDLTDRAAMFKSAPLKAALALAAGDDNAGQALLTMDDAIYRATLVAEIIGKNLNTVKDDKVRDLLATIIGSGPAADVEAALAPFLPK